MSSRQSVSRKRYRVDAAKVSRVQRILHAETETEAIERALDFLISEFKRNRQANAANERFAESRIPIRDVYGVASST